MGSTTIGQFLQKKKMEQSQKLEGPAILGGKDESGRKKGREGSIKVL